MQVRQDMTVLRELLKLDDELKAAQVEDDDSWFCGYGGLNNIPAHATVSQEPGIKPFSAITVYLESRRPFVKLRGYGYGRENPRERSVPMEMFHDHWVQRLGREPGPDERARPGTELCIEFWNACRAFLGD